MPISFICFSSEFGNWILADFITSDLYHHNDIHPFAHQKSLASSAASEFYPLMNVHCQKFDHCHSGFAYLKNGYCRRFQDFYKLVGSKWGIQWYILYLIGICLLIEQTPIDNCGVSFATFYLESININFKIWFCSFYNGRYFTLIAAFLCIPYSFNLSFNFFCNKNRPWKLFSEQICKGSFHYGQVRLCAKALFRVIQYPEANFRYRSFAHEFTIWKLDGEIS